MTIEGFRISYILTLLFEPAAKIYLFNVIV